MSALILGGGISGLSAAWWLHRLNPACKITLLEKTDRLGGLIQTKKQNGFLYELGPRTFQRQRAPYLLALIRDLGLENELIFSDPKAAKRYLWHRGHLRTATSFLPMLLPRLICEPFIPKGTCEDESIYEFSARRFSPKIAETLFDPLALGIYAGDIRKLSIRSCFSKLFQWEREKGSVVRGMFSTKKTTDQKGLFTLRCGFESLIEAMQKKIDLRIVFNCEVEQISDGEILAGRQKWRADHIFSALPAPAIGRLTGEEFAMNSLSVVNLAFQGNVLPKKGFGYLAPTQEKESLLGMIFDSSIFPEHCGSATRLTAMIRKEEPRPLEAALEAAKRHLGIDGAPLDASVFFAKDAIPLFEVGYWQKIAHFEARLQKAFPHLHLLGNYFENVSVEGCIERAFRVIHKSYCSKFSL
ncbi:MAG: protoporphyrinogen oxidase [Chlamydiota bacterium]